MSSSSRNKHSSVAPEAFNCLYIIWDVRNCLPANVSLSSLSQDIVEAIRTLPDFEHLSFNHELCLLPQHPMANPKYDLTKRQWKELVDAGWDVVITGMKQGDDDLKVAKWLDLADVPGNLVVLISSDKDFTEQVKKLRGHNIPLVLFHGSNANGTFLKQAKYRISWDLFMDDLREAQELEREEDKSWDEWEIIRRGRKSREGEEQEEAKGVGGKQEEEEDEEDASSCISFLEYITSRVSKKRGEGEEQEEEGGKQDQEEETDEEGGYEEEDSAGLDRYNSHVEDLSFVANEALFGYCLANLSHLYRSRATISFDAEHSTICFQPKAGGEAFHVRKARNLVRDHLIETFEDQPVLEYKLDGAVWTFGFKKLLLSWGLFKGVLSRKKVAFYLGKDSDVISYMEARQSEGKFGEVMDSLRATVLEGQVHEAIVSAVVNNRDLLNTLATEHGLWFNNSGGEYEIYGLDLVDLDMSSSDHDDNKDEEDDNDAPHLLTSLTEDRFYGLDLTIFYKTSTPAGLSKARSKKDQIESKMQEDFGVAINGIELKQGGDKVMSFRIQGKVQDIVNAYESIRKFLREE